MAAIITRTGKGAAITQSENDSNLDSLCGINEPQTGITYTVVAADQNGTIEFSNAAPVVATLALISTIIAANDTSDFQVSLKNIGAGVVTVTPTTDTFDDGSATKSLAQYEWITIQTDSTQSLWNIVASSNASKVDGLDASQFLRSDINDTTTGNITISQVGPHYFLNETDGGAGNLRWSMSASVAQFSLRAWEDAPSSVSSLFMVVDRTGQTIDKVALAATDIDLVGNITTSGTIIAAGDIALNKAAPSFTLDSDSGDGNAIYRDNGTLRALVYWSRSTDSLRIQMFDTDGSTSRTDLAFTEPGKMNLATGDFQIAGVDIATQLDTDLVTADTTNGDLEFTRNGTGDITVDTIPIYGLVVLDTPEVIVNSSSTEGSWSTVNSSTLNAANAVKAILRFAINCSGNSVRAEMDSYVRKTGSGIAIGDLSTVVAVENSGNFVTGRAAAQATVNLNANSDFDWYSNSTSGIPVTSVILVGYYV